VQSWLLNPLIISRLQPPLQQLQPPSLLELVNQLCNGALPDRVQQLLGIGLIIQINQSPQHFRSGLRIHLEQVDLDELLLLVLVQVTSQFLYELVLVTQVDQRSRIRKLHLLQELLYLLRIVVSCFLNHTLDFPVVAKSGTCLDVLEIYLWVICVRQHVCKVDQHPFIAPKVLQYLNTLFGVDL